MWIILFPFPNIKNHYFGLLTWYGTNGTLKSTTLGLLPEFISNWDLTKKIESCSSYISGIFQRIQYVLFNFWHLKFWIIFSSWKSFTFSYCLVVNFEPCGVLYGFLNGVWWINKFEQWWIENTNWIWIFSHRIFFCIHNQVILVLILYSGVYSIDTKYNIATLLRQKKLIHLLFDFTIEGMKIQ